MQRRGEQGHRDDGGQCQAVLAPAGAAASLADGVRERGFDRLRGVFARFATQFHQDQVDIRGEGAQARAEAALPGETVGAPAHGAAAEDDLTQVVFAGVSQRDPRGILAGEGGGFRAQFGGQLVDSQQARAPCLRQAQQLGRFHINDMPGHIELRRQAGAVAHQLFAARLGADADQQRILRRPDRGHRLVAPVGHHVLVHPVSGTAQGQLAQGEQIALAEKILDRPFRLLRQVNLALLQALQQLIRRQIDQHHLVRQVEQSVRQRFPDLDAGDTADHVVQRFQMLHVDGGVDVDAGGEQFLHILPAFGMTRTGGVGMRQLVHQQQSRLARQRRVQVELLEQVALVGDFPRREHFQPPQECRGL